MSQPESTPPADPEQNRLFRQILGVGGVLVIMLICLCAAAVFMYRSFTSAEDTPIARITQTSSLPPVGENDFPEQTQISASTATAPISTSLPPAAATFTPAPAAGLAQVLLVKDGDKSIFVINQGPAELPLGLLKLGNPPNQVSGEEFEISALKPGECVSVWNNIKDSRDEEPGPLQCTQVGEKIERKGNSRIWKSEFNIYYNGEYAGKCAPNQKDCEVQIELNP